MEWNQDNHYTAHKSYSYIVWNFTADISQEPIGSIFRTEGQAEQGTSMKPAVSTYAIPKIEAMCSTGTSVDLHRTTRCYIPEDRPIHNHGYENLKSYTIYK
jgi:hypothetical protein